MQGESAMNTKIKTLLQALIDEVNEVKGEKDSPQKAENWWKMVNWREPDMKTIYDTLSDGTKKLIVDEGLCPDCPEKKDFPVPPKDENPPSDPVPCAELLKKEHPDWSDEKIAEYCKEAESIDSKKKEPPKEVEKKEAEMTPEEKEEEEKKKKAAQKKEDAPAKPKKAPLDPRAVLERANRLLKEN